MTAQTSELIRFFAENGYQLAPQALSYLKEVVDLFDEYSPEDLVITLPTLRRMRWVERSHVDVNMEGFTQKSSWKQIKDDTERGLKLLLNALEKTVPDVKL
jgi:hypothetical protein